MSQALATLAACWRPSGPRRWVLAMLVADVLLVFALLASDHGLAAMLSLVSHSGEPDLHRLVLEESVLPRLVVAVLCGASLAASGALMQALLHNSLASPNTLGVANGSQLVLSYAMLEAPHWLEQRELLSMGGGCAALGLVLLLSWRRGGSSASLVLSGLVVTLYLGAINAALLVLQPQGLGVLFVWGAGSLVQDGWDQVVFLLPRVAIGAVTVVMLARPLQLLSLGDATASSLGIPVVFLRMSGLVVALFLSSVTVASVGIVGFVGLGAPAIANLLGAQRIVHRLGWSAVIGAALVLTVDVALQLLFGGEPGTPPTGAVIALFGAPVIVVLLHRMPIASSLTYATLAGLSSCKQGRLLPLLVFVMLAAAIGFTVGPGPDGWAVSVSADLLALRTPRVLSAIGAGCMLAVAGLILQRVTRNDMASPELLGLSASTAFGMLFAILAFPALAGGWHAVAGGLGGAITVTLLSALILRGRVAPDRLLLIGIAFTSLFDAVKVLVLANIDPRGPTLLGWLSGSTYFAGLATACAAVFGALTSLAAAFLVSRWLDMFPMGPLVMRTLSVPVERAHLIVLGIAAALTVGATLVLGPLSFIGLLAPHAARLLGHRRAIPQIMAAAMLGAATMALADWLGRTVLYPMQLPAGLTAAMVGGTYLICVLAWARGQR